MNPRYSKEVLQHHILKLIRMGYTRTQIAQETSLDLARLFNDDSYYKAQSENIYKIVELLHTTRYHATDELPETLALVQRATSFNAYLLNSKNAVDMLSKIITFNKACSPDNEYGWYEHDECIEFFIKQHPVEQRFSTSQGMTFYIALMLQQLLNQSLRLEIGAASQTYPDLITFSKYATPNINFDKPYSYIRIDKLTAVSPIATYNQNVTHYLENQFFSNFYIEEPETDLKTLIIADIKNAVENSDDNRFFNVDFVAARFGLSRSTLYRKLQTLDTSFSQIIDTFRKEESTKLLSDSFFTLEEISEKLGYSNISAFNRAFRRWHAISPAKYRQQS